MSIPKEPRQMMINMMYLVLTALLALNVSAEILNAFHIMNRSISNSNTSISDNNSAILVKFGEQLDKFPARVQKWDAKAKQADAIIAKFNKNINRYMNLIVKGSGGWIDEKGEPHDTNYIEGDGRLSDDRNLDVGTRLMVDQGRATELKNLIVSTRTSLLALIDDIGMQKTLDKQLPLSPIAKDYKNMEGESVEWEELNFHMVPSIACLAMLNKFQNDAKTSEAQILEYLFKKIDAEDIKVDRMSARVIAPSSYVLKGGEYKSDIFVAAYSSTSDPKVWIGPLSGVTKDSKGNYPSSSTNPVQGGHTIDVDSGMGHYTAGTGAVGEQTYTGAIEVLDGMGNPKFYPFEAKYQVGDVGLVVSPDKMNVFYIGVPNPVSISVPGFAAEKTTATMTGGSISKDGHGGYIVNATIMGAADISVSVQMPDGTSKVMGHKPFRVKQIPTPYVQLGGIPAGRAAAGAIKTQSFMVAKLDNFDFDLTFPVLSFDCQYAPYKQDLAAPRHVNGGNLSSISDLLSKAKIHDSYYFDNITVRMPDGSARKVQSISYLIN